MEAQVHSESDGDTNNVPQARRNGAQQCKACQQEDGLELFQAASKAIRSIGGCWRSEKRLQMHDGRGVILFGLALLACDLDALIVRIEIALVFGLRGRCGGLVVRRAKYNSGSDGKDDVQHVQLSG